jgi:hypothetical protein
MTARCGLLLAVPGNSLKGQIRPNVAPGATGSKAPTAVVRGTAIDRRNRPEAAVDGS